MDKTATPGVLTRNEIEAFRMEHLINGHPDGKTPQVEPWAVEENRILNALCDAAILALSERTAIEAYGLEKAMEPVRRARGFYAAPQGEDRKGAGTPDVHPTTIPAVAARDGQFDKQVLFSSWQDPRSWDVNAAAHDDPVITCATNADAKKAERLFNDLLARAEKAEAALSARGEPVAWRYTNKRTGDETFSNQPPDRVSDLTLYDYVPLYVGVQSSKEKP